MCLSRGFPLVLDSGAGTGAAGSAMVPGQEWQLLASLVTRVVWPQHSLQRQLQSCLAGDTGDRTEGWGVDGAVLGHPGVQPWLVGVLRVLCCARVWAPGGCDQ